MKYRIDVYELWCGIPVFKCSLYVDDESIAVEVTQSLAEEHSPELLVLSPTGEYVPYEGGEN